MTVSTQIIKRVYNANGVNRSWDVDFPLASRQDLEVWLTSPQGVEQEVEDFTLNASASVVEYPTQNSELGALETGWKITLLRKTPLTQEIDLMRHGPLDAEVLESGYDKLTLIAQELQTQIAQNKTDIAGNATALSAEISARANAVLAEETARTAAVAALQSAINGKQAAGDYATNTALSSGLSAKLDTTAAASTYLSKIDAASTYLSQSNAASTYLAQTDAASTYATQSALTTGLAAKQDSLSTAQAAAVNSGVTSSTVSQVTANASTISSFAPYLQKWEVRDMNEQEVVNAAQLLTDTGAYHSLDLNLSNNDKLKKLTAAGTSGSLANLSRVLVSNKAPFDSAVSPQLDVSYSTLTKTALVNLFNSMPYNVGYTVVGSPTIVDGVASGFSANDYLSIPASFLYETNAEIVIKAKPGLDSAKALAGTLGGGLGIYFNQAQIYVGITDASSQSIGGTFDSNTYYYIRVRKVGSTFYLDYSTDGTTYTGEKTIENATLPSQTIFTFGRFTWDGFSSTSGDIDISNTYIKINDIPFFRGTAAMTKTCDVRGCSGTADLESTDKAIATDKGWALTVA